MDPFLGEIRLMPYSYAPKGWLLCQGQIMSIASNTALFALLGTTFGGDGKSTFGIPDLRGRTYVGVGQGPGLSSYVAGQATGTESVTLQLNQMPAHVHSLAPAAMPAGTAGADLTAVSNDYYAPVPNGQPNQYSLDGGPNMAADVLSGTAEAAGGSQGHENRMPFLVMNYCIATQGLFPSRP
ncbi:tail fiber protein [Hymenobacter sp. 5317J-9]|uniref:phage tail protein n=1 Tax=Hymenobacter sp. 5317J-9 TaxID=2932250 RepID=UPI001FD66972|nr:tail fiber protein [Hymenobacter sp. 5317J-9]UOQ96783.1 tail fiber protein [Hymenobacter sp. 5317J-9]